MIGKRCSFPTSGRLLQGYNYSASGATLSVRPGISASEKGHYGGESHRNIYLHLRIIYVASFHVGNQRLAAVGTTIMTALTSQFPDLRLLVTLVVVSMDNDSLLPNKMGFLVLRIQPSVISSIISGSVSAK